MEVYISIKSQNHNNYPNSEFYKKDYEKKLQSSMEADISVQSSFSEFRRFGYLKPYENDNGSVAFLKNKSFQSKNSKLTFNFDTEIEVSVGSNTENKIKDLCHIGDRTSQCSSIFSAMDYKNEIKCLYDVDIESFDKVSYHFNHDIIDAVEEQVSEQRENFVVPTKNTECHLYMNKNHRNISKFLNDKESLCSDKKTKFNRLLDGITYNGPEINRRIAACPRCTKEHEKNECNKVTQDSVFTPEDVKVIKDSLNTIMLFKNAQNEHLGLSSNTLEDTELKERFNNKIKTMNQTTQYFNPLSKRYPNTKITTWSDEMSHSSSDRNIAHREGKHTEKKTKPTTLNEPSIKYISQNKLDGLKNIPTELKPDEHRNCIKTEKKVVSFDSDISSAEYFSLSINDIDIPVSKSKGCQFNAPKLSLKVNKNSFIVQPLIDILNTYNESTEKLDYKSSTKLHNERMDTFLESIITSAVKNPQLKSIVRLNDQSSLSSYERLANFQESIFNTFKYLKQRIECVSYLSFSVDSVKDITKAAIDQITLKLQQLSTKGKEHLKYLIDRTCSSVLLENNISLKTHDKIVISIKEIKNKVKIPSEDFEITATDMTNVHSM